MRIKKTAAAAKKTIVQKQIQAQVRFIVSNGDKYREESIEDLIEAFRQFTKERWPGANFTPVGSYYLVDGKVCRPEDFDRKTMDRKPGTFPPSWSLQGEDKKESILAERNAEQEKNPNKLAHQPKKLLTSKEMDSLNASSSSPRKLVAKKKVAEVPPAKKTMRVRRRSE